LIHIKLEAVEGVETSSTTLVMLDDKFDVIGLINQDGACYELVNVETSGYSRHLPPEYGSKALDWGPYHGSIHDVLATTKLGKTFAAEAVREISHFDPRWVDDKRDRELQLVGLTVMVCDSARIEPVRDAIARNWDNGTELTEQLNNYRGNWTVISGALLDWRDHAYKGWPQNRTLESMGFTSPDDALEAVALVFNDQDRICKY
jgi:hypothetical protein